MSLKLTQAEIDALVKDGALREEDGRRIHKMSPINRAKTVEVSNIIEDVVAPAKEPEKQDVPSDFGRAIDSIATAIRDSKESESESRTLFQDILKTALKSNEEVLTSIEHVKGVLNQKQPPKIWHFEVMYNSAGRIATITATEET